MNKPIVISFILLGSGIGAVFLSSSQGSLSEKKSPMVMTPITPVAPVAASPTQTPKVLPQKVLSAEVIPDSIKKPETKEIHYPKLLANIRAHPVVERVETEKDEMGIRSTLTVYDGGLGSRRTQLQEDWKDGPNGPELVGWSAMAADYIVVKLTKAESSELSAKLSDHNAKLEATNIPGVYKVTFDGTDPVNLHEINEDLKSVAEVEYSEPDFVMGVD